MRSGPPTFPESYGSVLQELGNSTKQLVHSEIALIKAELKETGEAVGKHTAQAAMFGLLLALSVIPFMAFLIIGLGEWLDGRYWLSSLIVAVVSAALGGLMAYRSYQEIKEHDLRLDKSREALNVSSAVVQEKTQEVKNAATGERHEIGRFETAL